MGPGHRLRNGGSGGFLAPGVLPRLLLPGCWQADLSE